MNLMMHPRLHATPNSHPDCMSVRLGALRVLRLKVLPIETLLQRINPR